MARVALLIGTGEYAEGLKALPAAPRDVEAIAAVLQDAEMGGFDRVETLINQPHTTIAETIETWFRERQRDDLALLYISGHGIKDTQSDLYFAANNTRKHREELVRSTAVAASFVRDRIRESRAKRQIIILDCCFSGAFGDLLARDDGSLNLESSLLGEELNAEGRVVLTSSSSIQYSFEQRDGELSIYTHYLVEGIRTGAADLDEDGAISVQDLHQYASRKVQEESPAMSPKIIVLKNEGYRIRIAKAPLGDPKVKYRKEVEKIVQEDGETIDEVLSRPYLEELQNQLGLTEEEARSIETEILEPIQHRQAKLQRYRDVFTRALEHKNPLGDREQKRLKQIQAVLGLLDENVRSIEDEVMAHLLSRPRTKTIAEALGLIDASCLGLPDHDALSSERGIDYTRLRDLLKAQDWEEADWKTYEVMIQTVGKESGDWFTREELLNFPCTDLKTIDALWIKYSNGHFGFSVQKQIYVACGAKLDGNYPGDEIWKQFCVAVGWRKNNEWQEYDELFEHPPLSSEKGKLPFGWGGVVVGACSGSLLSHRDL